MDPNNQGANRGKPEIGQGECMRHRLVSVVESLCCFLKLWTLELGSVSGTQYGHKADKGS